jgi:hypothetical protein
MVQAERQDAAETAAADLQSKRRPRSKLGNGATNPFEDKRGLVMGAVDLNCIG